MDLTTERVGARLYVAGNTYPIRDRLRAAGYHWDGERRQWWIGAGKAEALRPILDGPATAAPPEDLSMARVMARVEFKGRPYYQIAAVRDGARVRLVSLDGRADFWAAAAECRVIRTYPPREYRGRTEYTTIGSIRRFIEKQANPATRRGQCYECGAYGPVGQDCPECGGEGSYI